MGNSNTDVKALRKSTLISFRKILLCQPSLIALVFLFWVWLNLCLQGSSLFSPVYLSETLCLPSWIGPILFCSAFYFLMGKFQKQASNIVGRKWYLPALGFSMELGACLFAAYHCTSSLGLPQLPLLYGLSAFLLGSSTAGMLIELSRLFGCMPPREVLFLAILATACTSLAMLLLGFSNAPVLLVALLVIPIPMTILQKNAISRFPRKQAYERGIDNAHPAPRQFIATALVLGFSRGMLEGTLVSIEPVAAITLNAGGLAIAALLSFVFAIAYRLDFKRLVYYVGFPCIAAGTLLVSFTGFPPEVGIVVQLAGFYYTYFIIWGLCAYLIRLYQQSPIWIVAYSTAALMISQFSAGALSCALAIAIPSGALEALGTSTTILVLVVMVYGIGRKGFDTGWGAIRPATGSPTSAEDTNPALIEMSVLFGLTPRETEVFCILAEGRGRKLVQKELFISDNTAKAHIHSIYQKIGVHSHRELLERIERLSTAR